MLRFCRASTVIPPFLAHFYLEPSSFGEITRMTPRQARRERREADRKTKKLELKKSRLSGTAGPLAAEIHPANNSEIQPRWNPELEDEFPRHVQIRNNARMDRIALKAGLPIPPSRPDPGKSIEKSRETLRESVLARRKAAAKPDVSAEIDAGFVPQSRAQINRANAQLSTGPRTAEGKLASSRNSTKHGLASSQVIIPGEDPAAFDALLNNFLEEHQPATSTEELLVKEMAQSYWLTERAIRCQNGCFTEAGVNEKQLTLFLRYQTTHERAFYKALNTLLKLKKTHRQNQTGFVSQQRSKTAPPVGFVSHPATKLHSATEPHSATKSHSANEPHSYVGAGHARPASA